MKICEQLAKSPELVDSIIDLQRQADKLLTLIREGTTYFAGEPVAFVLATTAKAMLHDVFTLQDRHGADEWSEAKRQFALNILGDLKVNA